MPEIGSGTCPGFPAALDTDNVEETADDFVREQWGNDVAGCIAAIEANIGITAQGDYASVAARLATVSNPTGGGVPRGVSANRPAANAGTFYKSTDTGIFEYSDGANWYPLLGGG